MDGKIGFLNFR